ncbi:unnamed protein product [Effrenium voratum]|uniref:Uncharacterized protein n=1 Tax=Effrenium voratum TaxID=2562239 RepID=A0AA36HZ15_9DINO|nr:unnamed protein product [Effrenium voratum]
MSSSPLPDGVSLLALSRTLTTVWHSADPDAFLALRLTADTFATICESSEAGLLRAHVPLHLHRPQPAHKSWRAQVLSVLGPSWRSALLCLEQKLQTALVDLAEYQDVLSLTPQLSELWEAYMAIIDDHLLLAQGLLNEPAASGSARPT